MIRKANPTVEGQLLEYLEAAPDGKSEVMWNVLQHLRARQRGEELERPTIEGQIAEYFETAALEKAEALFNIVELKLGKRQEQEAEAGPKSGGDGPGRPKKGKGETRGQKARPVMPTPPVSAVKTGGGAGRTAVEGAAEGRMREPVMVPVDEVEGAEPVLEDRREMNEVEVEFNTAVDEVA